MMQSFTTLSSTANVLDMINVDTDMIIPKQFLKTIEKTGLGAALFFELRYDVDGAPLTDFPLNAPGATESAILISGENFGCGSSREHAPWALLDFGIRTIIAPSFADIFHNNCFRNGMLPIVLAPDAVAELKELVAEHPDAVLMVDLEAQTVTTSGAEAVSYAFAMDPFRKHCLLNGLDDIALTLQSEQDIARWEQSHAQRWRFQN